MIIEGKGSHNKDYTNHLELFGYLHTGDTFLE